MTKMNTKSIAQTSFEEALSELDAIIKQLEMGNIELDKAIELYKRGVTLKQHCNTKLNQAKLKVDKIIHENNQAVSHESSDISEAYIK